MRRRFTAAPLSCPRPYEELPDQGCGAAISRRDLRIILICSQGYQSSLAAATLQRLGLTHATDLDGGFTA